VLPRLREAAEGAHHLHTLTEELRLRVLGPHHGSSIQWPQLRATGIDSGPDQVLPLEPLLLDCAAPDSVAAAGRATHR